MTANKFYPISIYRMKHILFISKSYVKENKYILTVCVGLINDDRHYYVLIYE